VHPIAQPDWIALRFNDVRRHASRCVLARERCRRLGGTDVRPTSAWRIFCGEETWRGCPPVGHPRSVTGRNLPGPGPREDSSWHCAHALQSRVILASDTARRSAPVPALLICKRYPRRDRSARAQCESVHVAACHHPSSRPPLPGPAPCRARVQHAAAVRMRRMAHVHANGSRRENFTVPSRVGRNSDDPRESYEARLGARSAATVALRRRDGWLRRRSSTSASRSTSCDLISTVLRRLDDTSSVFDSTVDSFVASGWTFVFRGQPSIGL
jgi:hypothetical protein